eukprot:jgi/Orpsp1_1/1182187/evm.model.c7180000080254.1
MLIMNEKEDIINDIIYIIKNSKKIDDLKNIFKENSLKDLRNYVDNYYWYRCLVHEIENNNVSINILEWIYFQGKYNIFNSSFLSVAIEKNNFKIANYIIEKGEESINLLSYDNLLADINIKGYQYLLRKGLYITSDLCIEIIKQNKFKFLNQILKFFIFDNDFILLLLLYYKSKTEISNVYLNQIIEKEKKKVDFNRKLYEISVLGNKIEIINILYYYDTREKEDIFKDFYSIFNEAKNAKNLFINKLKNIKSKIPVNQKFIHHLECIITKFEIKEKISCFIKNNNINELQNYIQKNNILLNEYCKCFYKNDDLLKFAIKNSASMNMVSYIIKSCSYDLSKLYFDKLEKDEVHSIIHIVLSKNNYKLLDFLIKHGLDIHQMNGLSWLYENQQLNNKNLSNILSHEFCIKSNTICQLIMDYRMDVVEKVFKYYYFNNDFILKLLFMYQNKSGLTDFLLRKMIYRENNKISFNKSMYEKVMNHKNDETISFLFHHDTRNKEVILKDIFQIYDRNERIFHNGKKYNFIEKIKNRELELPIDSYFLDQLAHSEEIEKNLIEKINEENVPEIKYYLLRNNIDMTYFNHDQFDFLIYAIEQDFSFPIIEFIIDHYSSLDYTIHSKDSQDDMSPLFCALIHKNYGVVQLLLNRKASVNFRIQEKELLDKLYHKKLLNKKILKLLISYGVKISSKVMTDLIKDKRIDLLKIIRNNAIFDNVFILNLLSIYSHHIPLSQTRLKKTIIKEESKIDIGEDWFKMMMMRENLNIMEMFYHYRRCEREENLKLNKEELNCLLNYCIENDDYYLMNKIFNSSSFDFDQYDLEENVFYHYDIYSSFYDRVSGHLKILKFLVKRTFGQASFNLKNVKFYEKLNDIELETENVFSFVKFYIKQWLNHVSFNFKNYDFEKILFSLGFEGITKISLKEKTILLMKDFIEEALKHISFDFHHVSFENILDCLKHQIKLYCQKYHSKIEHLILLQLIIEQCISHKTFDFQYINFEEVLSILNDLSYQNDTEIVFNLLKFTIYKLIHHKTFDIHHINIKKDIMILVLQKDSLSIIKYFLEEIFHSSSFSTINTNYIEDILLTISRTESMELIEYVLEHLSLQESFDTKSYLLTISKIENIKISKFLVEKLFQRPSFKIDENNLKIILLTLCKINQPILFEILMEHIYYDIKCSSKLFNLFQIYICKLLKTAIRFNNIYFVNYIIEKLLLEEKEITLKSNFVETSLYYACKIDNVAILKLFLEKILFHQNSLESIAFLDSRIMSELDSLYLSLILNIFIKLKQQNLIQHLVKYSKVDINAKDGNGYFPLMISYSIVRENNDKKSLEIFNFLLDNGASCNICDKNNIPLLFLALKNNSYSILQQLFKRNLLINDIIRRYASSELIKAIETSKIENIKILIENPKIYTNNTNDNKNTNNIDDEYFSPLTIAYFLDCQEIFNTLMNYVNIYELDKFGYNILHYAVIRNDKDLIINLIKEDLDVNCQKSMNVGMVHSAIKISIHLKNYEILLILLSNNKNLRINDVNKNKQGLLWTILYCKNYTIEEKLKWMEDLIIHGADVNEYDQKGRSLLSYALKEKSIPMIKLFMTYGANINLPLNKTNSNLSILKYSLEHESLDLIECLIKYDKSNNISDEDIISLVKDGRFDLIQRLIPNIIDINRKYD